MGEDEDNKRRHSRMRLELPVEAQVDGGGYRNVQIVDISPTGLQLWTNDTSTFAPGEEVEFEVRFKAKMAWRQPMEDRSHLTGWEIEVGSLTSE